MKKIILVLILLLTVLTSCKSQKVESKILYKPSFENYEYDDLNTESYQKLVESINVFTSKLSSKIYDNSSDCAISPISLYMALSLACEASSGVTRNEILDLLSIDYDTLKSNIKLICNVLNFERKIDSLGQKNKLVGKISLTNSIWFDYNEDVSDNCLISLRDNYKCYSFDVDFKNNNSEANNLIRKFVYEQTNGLIDQNFNLDTNTLFTLINTLYLKDVWNKNGNDLSFSDEISFTNIDNSVKSLKLLVGEYNLGRVNIEGDYSNFYTHTDNYLKLTFIKPNTTLDKVFSYDNMYNILHTEYEEVNDDLMEIYNTKCLFPEFNASYNNDMKPIFQSLGVNSLFDNTCDFTNLTKKDVYASGIIHSTKLKVDKKGIEGAAVTVLPICGEAGPLPYKYVYETYTVDKAFGYVLSYKNIPLFIGYINEL